MKRKFDITKDMPRVTWKTLQDISKGGNDCVLLYMKYLEKANEQDTNQPHATNEDMASELGVWLGRIKNARAWLISHGFVETVKPGRVSASRWKKSYVKINKIVTQKKLLEGTLTGMSGVPVKESLTSTDSILVSYPYHLLKGSNILVNLKDQERDKGSVLLNTVKKSNSNGEQTTVVMDDVVSDTDMPPADKVDIRQGNIDKDDIVDAEQRLVGHALEWAKSCGKGLDGGRSSGLRKFIRNKLKELVNEGDTLEGAEVVLEIAITKFYDRWIDSRVYEKAPYGLVSTMKKQWDNLTS